MKRVFVFNHSDVSRPRMICVSSTVVSSMKEAQEKLTGDAFRQSHLGDEL